MKSADKVSMFHRVFWIFRFLVAFALIALLIFSTGKERLIETWARVNPLWAGCSIAASVVLFVLAGVNVWILLSILNPISFRVFLKYYSYSFVAALISPGQMGDASLSLFLKRESIPVRQSSVVYLLDKSITLLIFLSVSAWGVTLFWPMFKQSWITFVPAVGFFLFWAGVIFSLRFVSKLTRFPRVREWLGNAAETLSLLIRSWPLLFLNGLFAFAKWLIMGLSYYFAFLAFGKVVVWPVIGIIPVLSSLAGYIPVSIGGIGISEGTAVYFFSLQGIEKSLVLSSYILLRVIQFCMAGFVLFFFNIPLRMNKEIK